MKKIVSAFLLGNVCVLPLYAESLLTAQQFPKTFEDLSFTSRLEVLREGYMPYEIQYDENGVCISGCAYKGITIKEDMQAVDEATEEMQELINTAISEQPSQYEEPSHNEEPITPSRPPRPHPPVNNQPPSNNNPSGSNSESSNYQPPITNYGKDWCRNGLPTELPLRYPVDMSNLKYLISSDFGFRTSSPNGSSFHPAIDIGTPVGTPVYATADGVVVSVSRQTTKGGAGLYIDIKHANNLITQYLHLDTALVKKGDRVSACQQIATSGNSGKNSSGGAYAAHLDYRIRFDSYKNKYVDLLCPCKSSDKKTQATFDTNIQYMTCEHSLFYNKYKFKNYNPNSDDTKRSLWRTKHGHCMRTNTDLLPDEVK